jgi:type I restriction enzyme S subunit
MISKLNPHIPRIWFTGEVRPNAVCSTEFLVWTPTEGVSAEYVFCLATSTPFNSSMRQLVTGTSNSHQRVKPDYLAAIVAVVPPREITAAFASIAGPLLRRVLENRSIAQSLAQLRDTLLPRLISGKLRLPDAESPLEEVTG